MRHYVPSAVSSQRLLASAIGVAISAASTAQLACADDQAADSVISLDATSVNAAQDVTSYKTDTASSKKYTAPLRETPKSVTVIPQQVIRDTGATSLVDALRTTPGITFGAGEGGNPAGDRPIIRGFNAESDVFVDGMRDVASQSREIFNVESIEVAKGPGSAFTGAGSTGGSLNLVTKTAKLGDSYNGGFTWGSDQTKRTTLDLNKQLTDTSAFRLNLMKHEANVAGRDDVDVSRWGVAPSFAFGLGTDTRVTVGYYHLKTDDMPDYGIPLNRSATRSKYNVDGPAHVDRDNFYGLNGRDYRKTSNDSGTIRIEHDLNENLTLSNSFRMSRSTLDYIVTNPDDSKGNVANGTVYRATKNRNSTSKGWVNQTDLSAKFNTGFIEHSLVTGLEFTYSDTHNRGYVVTSAAGTGTVCTPALLASGDCTSLYDPSPDDGWSGTITDSQAFTDTNTKTSAAYVFDTLTFNEQWSLNLGLRYDDYQTKSSGYSTGGRGSVAGDFSRENNAHLWNYQVGVVYKPLPNGSIYAAWSTSSNPSGETSGNGGLELAANNSNLDPERNRNYEIGTKWDFFDDNLSLTAALFRTDKTNARVTDPDNATYQVLDGEQRVQGVELTYSGNLTSKWKVYGGYTYMESEIVKTSTAANEGNHMPSTPRNNFTFWSTYDIIPQLTVGAGATFVDSRFGDEANSVEVPSYWRYDAMATYRLTKNVDLQLNVQNLTDKRYFDQVFATHYAHVAPGRTALMSANFHF
ncbi:MULTISPECIES: TonB-dependent siderophore receptor [Pseudomonas]|uniref:TonB-dependent receptor n=1 Tax=Pseudomonas TaxID=286 RepID=UPI001AE181EC|nr:MULTISPECIES: TonB-dependent siderophore receptor [unclassified Pseudomonas]MBP2273252.1 catecholate siderophore receptor [Pseudomonas sp. BP6]MBP2287776.1 catecholate siderophore receptor [Pseudomonas sp. BP7]HDS1699181.1 TonB-dependent siderophore receptor [Pseudomonas putida]HDS1703478.1 TonB-dependent siderophore receptor [Pseudomonas putida]